MNDSNFAELGPRDPFAMLLDLDRVVRDMETSERLQRLQRRVCHPLDLPSRMMARGRTAAADFDRLIDQAPDEPVILDEELLDKGVELS